VQTAAAAPVPVPAATTWRYRISRTSSLYIAALLRNVCGRRVATFDLFAPDGSRYQRVAVPFIALPEGTTARITDGGYVVEMELEVAGSPLADLPGIWSVNVSLDGQADALGVGGFELAR
jgi:hypothetical protein